MVVGGLAIQPRRYADIAAAIQGIKDKANITSEMKWSKFRGGGRSSAYKAIINLFFSLTEQNQAHFHCLIAEFGKFTHRAFDGGDSESSVNKMYAQLLIHRICRYYASKCYIHVYPDKGGDSKDLIDYHGWINDSANKRYGGGHKLATIEPADSEKCNVLQMVDIIIGGIAHSCNTPKGAIGYKAALASYILQKAKRSTWLRDTGPRVRRVTVWVFKHRKVSVDGGAPRGARRFLHHG